MAAVFNAKVSQQAAYTSIISQKVTVTAISTVEFSQDNYLDFFETIVATATKVPTSFWGGASTDTPTY